MPGLQFPYLELLRETRALKSIASSFLNPSYTWVLDKMGSHLESIGAGGEEHVRTLELSPLYTRSSNAYEAGVRRGGKEVYAVMTGTWHLRALGTRSSKVKVRNRRLVEFCGIASTKIELFDDADATRLAMWRLELGAEDSPGCYIHAQILGDAIDPPFPKTLPIPRLPSLFLTPLAAIEYVLGELFQDEWKKAVMQDREDQSYWRHIQRERLRKLLDWQQRLLENVLSSPWMTLKSAVPDDGAFLI